MGHLCVTDISMGQTYYKIGRLVSKAYSVDKVKFKSCSKQCVTSVYVESLIFESVINVFERYGSGLVNLLKQINRCSLPSQPQRCRWLCFGHWYNLGCEHSNTPHPVIKRLGKKRREDYLGISWGLQRATRLQTLVIISSAYHNQR